MWNMGSLAVNRYMYEKISVPTYNINIKSQTRVVVINDSRKKEEEFPHFTTHVSKNNN